MEQINLMMILAVAFAMSEALSMIPQIKANGVFQLIYNMLKNFKKS